MGTAYSRLDKAVNSRY